MSEVTKINFEKLKVSCSECGMHELCFPRGMVKDDMAKLDEIVERKRPVHKNDYLFHAGDKSQALYAVRSGCVKSFVESSGGEEQIVGFHMPGELLGLDGFQGNVHNCSAVALETSSICELPLDKLDVLCHSIPALQDAMRMIMGKEVTEDHAMLLLLGRMNSEQKLASFLSSMSKRMEERHWKPTEFVLAMPRQDIANYLGLAVETVSRLFAHFQDEGLIEVDRRRVNILDIQAIKIIAGECKVNLNNVSDSKAK